MSKSAHDTRTLEERLRWIADWSEPDIDLADAGTAREALERIEQLTAENERLREALGRIANNHGVGDISWEMTVARAAAPALMEEGARLALERIVAWLRGEVATDYTDPQFDIGQNLARAIEAGEHLPAAARKTRRQSNG